jgi:K+-sensing histidine kinase KdpD
LDTFAALVAIALERVHYVGVAQEALLKMESERLRNSLLAAVSHDLRTPLTVLQGLAELLTGPGLPAGKEDEVFQKFTRGHRESSTRGVGLGLTICRAIVESHRGSISGSNRPGGGAVFTFTLPLGSPPSQAMEQ